MSLDVQYDQNIRVAVIGCGGWGKNITRTMNTIGSLAAVVDPTEAGQQRARELAPDADVYSDIEDVLNRADIQAVMIATPAETHYSLACRAMAAGKDVFVEKPITLNLEEAEDLVVRAKNQGRILMVGHLLEYHPAILKLREMIAAGELGNIQYVISNRLNLGKIRTEENALWSFAPHDIAVILRLVDAMPFEIVATGGSYVTPNIADTSLTQLLFDNGVRSHIFVSWLHPFKEQRLVVVGSKKMASFCDITKELILYDQRVDWQEGQPVPVRGDGVQVEFPADEPLRAECEHFLKYVTTRETPLTDGENGVRVLRILYAAQQSLMTNGSKVLFTMENQPLRTDEVNSANAAEELGLTGASTNA